MLYFRLPVNCAFVLTMYQLLLFAAFKRVLHSTADLCLKCNSFCSHNTRSEKTRATWPFFFFLLLLHSLRCETVRSSFLSWGKENYWWRAPPPRAHKNTASPFYSKAVRPVKASAAEQDRRRSEQLCKLLLRRYFYQNQLVNRAGELRLSKFKAMLWPTSPPQRTNTNHVFFIICSVWLIEFENFWQNTRTTKSLPFRSCCILASTLCIHSSLQFHWHDGTNGISILALKLFKPKKWKLPTILRIYEKRRYDILITVFQELMFPLY